MNVGKYTIYMDPMGYSVFLVLVTGTFPVPSDFESPVICRCLVQEMHYSDSWLLQMNRQTERSSASFAATFVANGRLVF